MRDKKVWLQVPTEIVRNIGYDIDEKTFAVFVYLLYKKFRTQDKHNNIIEVDHISIKNALRINDNRTLKNCLKKLYEQNLIINDIDILPIRKKLKLEFNYTYREDWFTQLPLNLNHHIESIGLMGFRLLYYYESYINRNDIMKDYCFPAYETIITDLNISDKTLTRYNNKLKKEKLISITKHQVHFDNPFDEDKFDRFNNHYRVNLSNI